MTKKVNKLVANQKTLKAKAAKTLKKYKIAKVNKLWAKIDTKAKKIMDYAAKLTASEKAISLKIKKALGL